MSQNKTIKFFISSTFKDFLKERNTLQNFVFPRLKKLCKDKGFSFQPVDLRWGITEESSEDNRTMDYCLNEVSRCSSDPKPNILILIGQRYGWGPLPTSITLEEWVFIKLKICDKDLLKLKEWYTQDLNDLDKNFFLKEKQILGRKTWESIEEELKTIIQTATIEKKSDPEYSRFHTSATEQEIKDAIEKQYTVDSNNTIVYNREFSTNEDSDFIENDNDAQEKLTQLKKYLTSKKLTSISKSKIDIANYKLTKNDCKEYGLLSDDLKYFCVRVLREFGRNIQKEIKKYNQKHDTPLKIELSEQKKNLEEKSKLVLGRDDEIKEIKNFIINSDEQFYLLYGESGSGKTSIISRTVCELKKACIHNTLESNVENEMKFDSEIIYRFIGSTAHSTSPRDTYEHIYWEIVDKELINKPSDIENDDQKFYEQFNKALKNYTQDKKLILFIDAVDQFNGNDSLEIFLSFVPKNVKVVFSCLYDKSKDNKDYERLNHIKIFKKLDTLNGSFNKKILKKWFKNTERQLDYKIGNDINPQWNILINKCKDKTPLYLRLACEVSKEWKSTTDINHCILKDNKKKLIKQFFENVINKHYVKRELLELSLGLISVSKDGLSEKELIDILSNEKDILALYEREGSSYPKLSKLPDAIFSKMYYHIQDIFTEKFIDDEMLINPYHRIVEEVIKEEYYSKSLYKKTISFFKSKSDKRSLKELAWAYFNINKFQDLSILLYKPCTLPLFYEYYKSDLFMYQNFLSKNDEYEKTLEVSFKLQELTLNFYNKNDEQVRNKVSKQALVTGLFYKDIAKYEYAKKMFVLGINSSGNELPNNMISYIGILVNLNQFEDALKVIDDFSTDKIKDSSFAMSLNSLKAVIYKRLGKYDEATILYDDLEDNNLTILFNKAILLKTSGKKEESKKVLEDILSRVISDFEFKLRVKNSYASLLKELGEINEAYELLKKLYKDAIEYFPEDNELLFSIGNNYSKVCIEVDDEEIKNESLNIQEELLNTIRKVHGDSLHETSLLIKHNLSESNYILGNTLAAINYAKEAYEGRKELFGIEHKDTILSLLSYFKLIIIEENFDKQILANYFKDLYLHRNLIHNDDKYDKEILYFSLQIYCDQYYDMSCQECSEISFNISNQLKEQGNYKKAVNYDVKRYNSSINNLNTTKNYFNFVAVSTTLAGTYFKLNLKNKVIEIEKKIVDVLRSNYNFIFNEQRTLGIIQFVKSIKNLSSSFKDNGDIEESIPYLEEVLEFRYTVSPSLTPTLDINTDIIIEDDVYGIFKIDLDEYLDSLNQLATFAYKNKFFEKAEEIQEKAIRECIKNLEKDYDRYLKKALDYYSDLSSMFLFSNLSTAKTKYEDTLNFIQNEFENNNINKETCIKKQQSVLNGIKLFLSHFLETKKEIAIDLNNLLIDLDLFLCTFDKESWIDEYIEQKKVKIKFLKDNGQLNEAIESEIEIGKCLFQYQSYIDNWQDKIILHLSNLATGYYNVKKFKDAQIIALNLINLFEENYIEQDILYENAKNIIKLIKQQENSLNNFIIKDSESRDYVVKVLFLLEETLSDDKLKSLLNDNDFTDEIPYDYCICNSSSEIDYIQQYYGEDIVLPALVYYFEGEVEFIKNINLHTDEDINMSELLSNKSLSKYNEPFETLLVISKGLAITNNNSEEIRLSELFNALHSVELSPQSKAVFIQIFGDNMNELNEDTDGYELIKLAKQYNEINHDDQMNNLVQQLKELFVDDLILNVRTGVVT